MYVVSAFRRTRHGPAKAGHYVQKESAIGSRNSEFGMRVRIKIPNSSFLIQMRIGIDLGGTKIEGIAIADDGRERLRRRIPAPRGDYANTLTAVAGLVRAIEHELAV